LNGEIDIYRKLYSDLHKSEKEWHIWHDLKLPFHSDNVNPYQKTSSQIDFLILCEEGILVLEVKGGPISFKNNTFYHGNNYETVLGQDPFSQAEGYKYTIKDRVLHTGTRCMLTHAVAFPHCFTSFGSKVIECEVLWTQATSGQYDHSIEEFITSVFKHNRNKHKRYHRNFPKLSANDINEVRRILSPIVHDLNRYYNADTTEWLNISNLDILESLSKNDRIMIQGCPGTGKTTLAKAFIDRQMTKKGLYLCWNNLLMHKTRHDLQLRGVLKTCEVNTLSRFLLELDTSLQPQDLIQLDESGFYDLVSTLVGGLKAEAKLPQYDYLVIDEGQDILDRGVDILINELLGGNSKGLNDSRVLLLYDIDQSYSVEGRDVTEIADLISIYFAHFRLNEIRRSAQYPEIREIAEKAIKTPMTLGSELFKEGVYHRIKIHYFDSLETIKNHLVKNILRAIRDNSNSLKGNDCIVLIESILLKTHYGTEPGMYFHLEINDVEELTEKNIGDTSNKLRFTSILRYKGLEKENVILIVRNPSHLNKYELYIGVTRAISNLEILVMNK